MAIQSTMFQFELKNWNTRFPNPGLPREYPRNDRGENISNFMKVKVRRLAQR